MAKTHVLIADDDPALIRTMTWVLKEHGYDVTATGDANRVVPLMAERTPDVVLLVTANTMSMAVRERRTEIAVLKTLGFSSARVMGLILTEALILAASAGLIGTWLANLLVSNIATIPYLGAVLGQFPKLQLSGTLAAATMGFSLALGLVAGFVPAWGAYRAKIVDTLRAA